MRKIAQSSSSLVQDRFFYLLKHVVADKFALQCCLMPCVKFYITSELALILDTPKANYIIFPVLMCVINSVYFYAVVLFFPHIFVPSEEYQEKKIPFSFMLCIICCTFDELLQIHYEICKIHCSINPLMISFLTYFSLDFCMFSDFLELLQVAYCYFSQLQRDAVVEMNFLH